MGKLIKVHDKLYINPDLIFMIKVDNSGIDFYNIKRNFLSVNKSSIYHKQAMDCLQNLGRNNYNLKYTIISCCALTSCILFYHGYKKHSEYIEEYFIVDNETELLQKTGQIMGKKMLGILARIGHGVTYASPAILLGSYLYLTKHF